MEQLHPSIKVERCKYSFYAMFQLLHKRNNASLPFFMERCKYSIENGKVQLLHKRNTFDRIIITPPRIITPPHFKEDFLILKKGWNNTPPFLRTFLDFDTEFHMSLYWIFYRSLYFLGTICLIFSLGAPPPDPRSTSFTSGY